MTAFNPIRAQLTWNEKLAVHRAIKHYAEELKRRKKRGQWTHARYMALYRAWHKLFGLFL